MERVTPAEGLLFVILILLAGALVMPRMSSGRECRDIPAAKRILESVRVALEQYRRDRGAYPERLQDLWVRPDGVSNGKAPPLLIEGVIQDPWGKDLRYFRRNPQLCDLWSAGPDGQDGTEDDVY